jgi:DNA segregation ATPase FtsK/SpoIIIE-like protein
MPFPETTRLALPILQELHATGGSDQVQYLYARLESYFPQLTPDDLAACNDAGRNRWRLLVQRAGKELESVGELKRERTHWLLTPRGSKRVTAEAVQFAPTHHVTPVGPTLTHKEAQQMLVEIGHWLGHYAQMEFERYDVVWRETEKAPRLSHVFEVQISGSVDSALTHLKHAYEKQRSMLFLVIANERDQRFTDQRMSGAFHEIWKAVTVIGVGELQRLHQSLSSNSALLERLTHP